MNKTIYFLLFVFLPVFSLESGLENTASGFKADSIEREWDSIEEEGNRKLLKESNDVVIEKEVSKAGPGDGQAVKELILKDKESVSNPLNNASLEKSSEERSPSSAGKIKKTKINRDQSFKVPDTKIPSKKRKRLSLKHVQPPSSAKLYYAAGSDEAELEKVINEEISYLFKLLKKNRNADLTLRLGGLYVDKARLISLKIQTNYENNLEDFKRGVRKTKPYLNLKAAQTYNKKSLQLFKDFKEYYPKHKRMDEVLFFLGFNFYQLERTQEGIKHFSELEVRFPRSPYLYESRFQLGEHYFKLGKWKSSFTYYDKISKNKRGKFYFFALYKMAWSSYKMGRASKGLALLERIIKEGRKFKVVSDRNQTFIFTDEAIEDLVLFYTYSSKPPELAKSFFLNLLDEKTAWILLKRLAYAYRDTGQTKSVLVLFEELIDQNPVGEKAFEYQYQIVETMYNFGKISKIISSLSTWVKNYGPDSSWAQSNRGNQNLLRRAFTLQEVTVRNYGLKNHETFRRTKSNRAKTLALSFYKIYFNYFAKSRFSDQMHFFYGELLFDTQRYVSAVKSYEEVIANFSDSKYAKAAYVNQLLALEKVLPKEAEIQKLVGKGEEPVELSRYVKSFMKIATRYVSKFPREKNIPSILYRMAALYYKFNQFSMAAKYFKKLSDEHPTSKLVSNVGGILLDIYNKNKDYKSLEELALKLTQNKNVDPVLLREVKSVLEQISFKKAQDLALNKQYRESAVLYEKFARSNPRSSLAPSAFYNAGLNFEKSGDRLKAIAMYSSVLTYKGRQNAKIRKNSQKFLAILYEKLGFYKTAASAYVSFAKAYPSDPKSSDFWYNAGIIFDALNDIGSAVYSYQKHFAISKKVERYEVFYLIALMYEKNRRWQKTIENYGQYLKSPSSNKIRIIKASYAVADIYEKKIRNAVQARVWHQKTLGLYKRLRVGVSYGARSHFYITQSLYEQFSRVKIPVSAKKQEAAVAKKLKLLNNLQRALKPIIRYNDGEQILASLALIGQANQEMAKAIYQAPVPKGLNKQGLAQYKEGIKKLIEPYIKEALKSYQLVLKKSSELKVYSEWVKKAYNGLASIQIKNGTFQKFLRQPVHQEILPLRVIDNTGTVTESFLKTLTKSLKYGVSRSDFESLVRAMAIKKEGPVLKAVSAILNKDPDNVVAINSLALFYLQNNRQALGVLILNRVSSKKTNEPVIMNNLAVVSLKYGDVREAITYLKKALKADSSYAIARVNLATLFLKQFDYINSYFYYNNSYKDVFQKWSSRDQKKMILLNNYAVALTGAKQWKQASLIFKNLINRPSPRTEFLLNYSIFLTEKSKGGENSVAKNTLLKAREIADELTLYASSASLKNKLKLLLRLISARLRELKQASQEKQKGG